MKTVLDLSVPALVFLMMVIAGTGLTVEDFRRAARKPGTMAVALLGQVLLLPLIAILLVSCLSLDPDTEAAILLVAACPAGPMGNLYTFLARGTLALSVSLTAFSCVLAVITMPTLIVVFRQFARHPADFAVPVSLLAANLVFVLLVPILVGMVLRHFAPALTTTYERTLFRISMLALVALIVFVIAADHEQFTTAVGSMTPAVVLLTVGAMAAGYALGWLCGGTFADRSSLVNVFVVRNVGIALAISVTVLNHVEFAVFGMAYFVTQTPMILAFALFCRWGMSGSQIRPQSPDDAGLPME